MCIRDRHSTTVSTFPNHLIKSDHTCTNINNMKMLHIPTKGRELDAQTTRNIQTQKRKETSLMNRHNLNYTYYFDILHKKHTHAHTQNNDFWMMVIINKMVTTPSGSLRWSSWWVKISSGSKTKNLTFLSKIIAVSYTHLDVYKRQLQLYIQDYYCLPW